MHWGDKWKNWTRDCFVILPEFFDEPKSGIKYSKVLTVDCKIAAKLLGGPLTWRRSFRSWPFPWRRRSHQSLPPLASFLSSFGLSGTALRSSFLTDTSCVLRLCFCFSGTWLESRLLKSTGERLDGVVSLIDYHNLDRKKNPFKFSLH